MAAWAEDEEADTEAEEEVEEVVSVAESQGDAGEASAGWADVDCWLGVIFPHSLP
jgi:hypothetical protein